MCVAAFAFLLLPESGRLELEEVGRRGPGVAPQPAPSAPPSAPRVDRTS
jgi:hypothetical protein